MLGPEDLEGITGELTADGVMLLMQAVEEQKVEPVNPQTAQCPHGKQKHFCKECGGAA
jgi:hypothetical protein